MKHPSDARWLYLHFLDRELLMTCGLYGALSLHRVRDDFVMSLLSISEPAYVSTSVLFESDYAFELFRQYGALFSRQDILRLATVHDSLVTFVLGKRESYPSRSEHYPRYFSDVWKEVEDHAPLLASKSQDTTRFLHGRVEAGLAALPMTFQGAEAARFRMVVSRLRSVLEANEGAPVIAALFEPVYRAELVPASWRYVTSLQISLAYVESYLSDYDGTIPVGLRCGLHALDALSRTPRIHDLEVWREIYTRLGIYPHVLTAPAGDLLRIRGLGEHGDFIQKVREMLKEEPPAPSGHGSSRDRWLLAERVSRSLLRGNHDTATSFVGFVSGVLRLATATGAGGCHRTRVPPEARYFLDVETRTLRSTAGLEIVLSEGTFRVLLALLEKLPGLDRIGRLSNEAVAALYTGARKQRSSSEAVRIAYQFTRSLRRTLSQAGVVERDALVRRVRTSGIALGTRWAASPVRGKAEVGLFLGRRS